MPSRLHSSMAALIPRTARVPLGYSISTSFRRIIKQSPYSLSNRPFLMGSGRHNIIHSHIIYGFSGHCNVSLQIPFKVFPGKFFRFPAAPAPWKAVFCFENSLRSDKKHAAKRSAAIRALHTQHKFRK